MDTPRSKTELEILQQKTVKKQHTISKGDLSFTHAITHFEKIAYEAAGFTVVEN